LAPASVHNVSANGNGRHNHAGETVRKKLYIKTYGCQMNVYDSKRMTELLAPLGYAPAAEPDDADLILLNTCHIREKAAEKVYSELGKLRAVQDNKAAKGERALIAVAGCVAQAEGEEILARAPQVDMVVGPQTYHRLPELIAQAERLGPGRGVIDTDFPAEDKFDKLPQEGMPDGPAAFLSIQEGCDKFCTFCVVPYTRGAEYSRPAADVIAEARRLVAKGARELTLLGQNVNAYHGEAPDQRGEWGLGRLIRELAEIDGLERIRYTTSHPRDVDAELIAAHRDVPQLMPYLHLPVQSGSDRVLHAMNRRHTSDDYRRIVDRLREVRPEIAMASDFIVGFPGETAADHAATLRLIADVGFSHAYAFKYSPRPGTPAWAQDGHVPEQVKSERLAGVQQLLDEQQRAFNHACVGRRLPVIMERRGKHPGQIAGRSPFMQSVHVAASPRLLGRTVEVDITHAHPSSLHGTVATATWESEPDGVHVQVQEERAAV
jgi:tRNA-2-methylthio-N6-dimethylallyladenosine synthase